ncbi:MAG: serine/threonine protein kinase [Lentisphaerae bacterium]|nr:MAG: serine/threonine protein kinase [Lentisphaerota bacterium]
MLIPCQKCSEPIECTLSGIGGIIRCPACHMLNAFLRKGPDGQLTFGNYKIIKEVGQGANAIVCKVRHVETGAIRALKLFCAEDLAETHARKEFFRESQVAVEFVHPNIVQVFESGVLDEIPYIVMEYLTGLNLAQLLNEYGCIDQFDGLTIAIYVLDALDYVWSNFLMIHRDIKPSNIILDKSGHVKVCDFGMVTGHESAAVDLDSVEGTPYYLSPECVCEDGHLDNRSDIYSLGASLYHAISGVPPFNYSTLHEVVYARVKEDPPNLRQVFPEIHPEIAAIINVMMARNPDDRYFTAQECKEDMERVKSGLSPFLHKPQT